MADIIWRKYKLGELFSFSAGSTFALKDYNLYDDFSEGMVEVVTSSKDNDSNQFILKADIPSGFPIYSKSLTINRNGSIGYCHYHDREFIIPTGDSYTLVHENKKFEEILDRDSYMFLSIIITHIFAKSVFGYCYKVNSDRFEREFILLPCIEVEKDSKFVWEEDGKYYSLAIDYIGKLMRDAKELREKKTIRLYESEKAGYETERAKYEAGYKKERDVLVWRSFKLGDLFTTKNGRDSNIAQKNLDKSEKKDSEYNISIVTESMFNNAIGFYLKDDDPVLIGKVVQKGMTIGTQFGNANWHNYPHFIIGNVNYITFNNEKLYNLCNDSVGQFLAKIINNIFKKSELFGFVNKIDQNAFYRELILLPCLEVADGEDYIWEEAGKRYTLAVDYISYVYLTGRVSFNQKRIDNYTYQY